MTSLSENKIIADPSALEDCTLLDENNNAIKMKSLWKESPAVFIFLRHFGCAACRKHALQVWNNREAFEQRGAKIHFIGNGAPHFLKAFKADNQMETASFYTDPKQKSFKAAGFRRGFWIDPGEMHTRGEFLRLAVRHAIRDSQQGDVWQLGGILVMKPGNVITYQFTSQAMGHFPPSADVAAVNSASDYTKK